LGILMLRSAGGTWMTLHSSGSQKAVG